jgi:hypothetical protein
MELAFPHCALLRTNELQIGTRKNGVFLVFGQTAMFFYLATA